MISHHDDLTESKLKEKRTHRDDQAALVLMMPSSNRDSNRVQAENKSRSQSSPSR